MQGQHHHLHPHGGAQPPPPQCPPLQQSQPPPLPETQNPTGSIPQNPALPSPKKPKKKKKKHPQTPASSISENPSSPTPQNPTPEQPQSQIPHSPNFYPPNTSFSTPENPTSAISENSHINQNPTCPIPQSPASLSPQDHSSSISQNPSSSTPQNPSSKTKRKKQKPTSSFQEQPTDCPTSSKPTLDEIGSAVIKAHNDLLSKGDTISALSVIQSTLLSLEVDSWDSLGVEMKHVPPLHSLMVIEGRVNTVIKCFMVVQNITSLYDLDVAICEAESVKKFEDLKLGPLLRHPLVVRYFKVPLDVKEVYRITSEEIISRLFEFVDICKEEKKFKREFLEFLATKESVDVKKLGVRIHRLKFHVTYIRDHKKAEESTLKNLVATLKPKFSKKSRKQSPSQQKVLDGGFCNTPHGIKSISPVPTHADLGGKPDRFLSSGLKDENSDMDVDSELESKDDENLRRSQCKTSTQDVQSSDQRLEVETNEPSPVSGSLSCDTSKKPSGKKRTFGDQRSDEPSCRSSKTYKAECAVVNVNLFQDNDVKQLRDAKSQSSGCSAVNENPNLTLTDDMMDRFIKTWKDTCLVHPVDEVFERMINFYNSPAQGRKKTESMSALLRLRRKIKSLFSTYPCIGLLNIAVKSIKCGMYLNDTFQTTGQLGCITTDSDASTDFERGDKEVPKEKNALSVNGHSCQLENNGTYSSVAEGTIWLHSEAFNNGFEGLQGPDVFPILYAKLRTVCPALLSTAAANMNSCEEETIDNCGRMLNKIGIQRLSAHDAVMVHILPAISDDRVIDWDRCLMTEYLSYVMLHLQSNCPKCCIEREHIIRELRSKAFVLTNHGYKKLAEVAIHFSKEFGNPVDVNKLIDAMESQWHEIDSIYLNHANINKSSFFCLMKWREFFQELGITDFVQVIQVEKKIADLPQNLIYDGVIISPGSVLKDWESPELVNLLSTLSTQANPAKCKYLLEVLDEIWDDLFGSKVSGCCISKSGEDVKLFKSSFIKCIHNSQWVVSSMDQELHYPKDLFHDCEAVRSILGALAPYAVPQLPKVWYSLMCPIGRLHETFMHYVHRFFTSQSDMDTLFKKHIRPLEAVLVIIHVASKNFVIDVGFKTKVTLDDGLRILEVWRRCKTPFKTSIAQMSRFYSFISDGLVDNSKEKIMQEFSSKPSIFVPIEDVFRRDDVIDGVFVSRDDVYWYDPSGFVGLAKDLLIQHGSTNGTNCHLTHTIAQVYHGLRNFFVDECGVCETPPIRRYIQILIQLSNVAPANQTTFNVVFRVILKWAGDLNSGFMREEDMLYLKELLFKLENTVLLTVHEKWVSLHPSFGHVYWCDDEDLKSLSKKEQINFLYFGKLTNDEKFKICRFMQTIGVPSLSEVVTREVLYSGVEDYKDKESLVNWALPFAQRYIYELHRDKYLQLKQSGFEGLTHLQIVVVENLCYSYTIKDCSTASKKCSCLLQENVMYMTQDSDSYSIYLELSRLFYNGKPESHIANFLHKITTLAERGSTNEQTEFFIVNNQKIPKVPADEPIWCLPTGPLEDSEFPRALCPRSTLVDEQNQSMSKRKRGADLNQPPADENTTPSHHYARKRRRIGTPTSPLLGESSQKEEEPLVMVSSTDDHGIPVRVGVDCAIQDESVVTMAASLQDLRTTEDQPCSDTFTGSRGSSNERDQFIEEYEKTGNDVLMIGRLGEFIAFQYFTEKFGEENVNWVNKEDETGLPYDMVIMKDGESQEYIEVKASKHSKSDFFAISLKEWQFAVEKGESFSIARVFLKDLKNTTLAVLKNPTRLCQQGTLGLFLMDNTNPYRNKTNAKQRKRVEQESGVLINA